MLIAFLIFCEICFMGGGNFYTPSCLRPRGWVAPAGPRAQGQALHPKHSHARADCADCADCAPPAPCPLPDCAPCRNCNNCGYSQQQLLGFQQLDVQHKQLRLLDTPHN